jgi:sugar phosphate isomerase/epimerase
MITEVMAMLNPKKTRERETLLKRIRELDQEITEGQGRLWELKKRHVACLPIEEQFAEATGSEFYILTILRTFGSRGCGFTFDVSHLTWTLPGITTAKSLPRAVQSLALRVKMGDKI